jgi:ABC-type molybdate transport system permease subunit
MILLDASLRLAVVAALAAAILGLTRARSSALRHGVWTLVLGAMLLMPVLPAVQVGCYSFPNVSTNSTLTAMRTGTSLPYRSVGS